ncbi:hypothetical protein WJX74_006188 [Apatococcus lobatus]|uniref:DNA-directed RNA polymerase III subunit RPC9 n=2 Tax=Apatococcus TaxID=904362 RepID=A0AAW1SRD5_9CHLO
MQIVSSSITLTTNPEVLRLLKERQAAQHGASLAKASQSKVLEYLEEQNTLQLPTEELQAFGAKAQEEFGLNKVEVLHLINLTPTRLVEVSTIIQESEQRTLSDEQLIAIKAHVAQALLKQDAPAA